MSDHTELLQATRRSVLDGDAARAALDARP